MERALLVSINRNGDEGWDISDSADELKSLAESSGAVVVDEVICSKEKPTPKYFIGKGKAEEIAERARLCKANLVIFNEDLSFAQHRNLEDIINVKVIDRTQLILDIFAQRAKSNEGKVQVELAQLLYLLPRLMGKGIMLSRLGGGIGTRGPGEQKLEMDRRRIRKKIAKLDKELESIKQHRSLLRRTRESRDISTVAIIGYTNAGKSTLLNTLTHSNAYVKNQLFSTLDPLSKRLVLPNNQKAVFVDTVGFIHKLPHHLIDAFKATLEEVVQADVLIHILDISSPIAFELNKAVYQVLTELGAQKKPIITALNKIDLVENPYVVQRFAHNVANSVAISALKGEGVDELLGKVMAELSARMAFIRVFIPESNMGLLSQIYDQGQVHKTEYREGGVYVEATVPVRLKKKLEMA